LLLFDHFIGAGEERLGHFNTDGPGGPQVNQQLVFGPRLNGQVRWLLVA
jgi:hypothetical protein